MTEAAARPNVGRFKGKWWTRSGGVRASIDAVKKQSIAALEKMGIDPADALFVTDAMLNKDLQQDHLRGIADLPGVARRLREGKVVPRPKLEIVKETPGSAVVRAASGIPFVVCRHAMLMCMDKARSNGIAAVGVQERGNTLTPYSQMAVEAGMIGFASTQSIPVMAPSGGRQPILGNSPISFGFPVPGGHHLLIDMALTQSSATPCFGAARDGRQLPEGVALDQFGRPTRDPMEFAAPGWIEKGGTVARGSLLPIGEYKGYALVLAFGFLTSLLIGTSPSWDLSYDLGDKRGQPGTFLMAINVASFRDPAEFAADMRQFLDRVRGSDRIEGVDRIYYPGERSAEMIQRQIEAGWVELPERAVAGLEELFASLGLNRPIRIG